MNAAANVPTPAELLAQAQQTAFHLEMRDVYGVPAEDEDFKAWEAGHRDDPNADPSTWWRPWLTLVREVTARGVHVRRARIVSEPVSKYIRFEYDGTFTNVYAGERVRWLPRRQTSGLLVPPNDFWVFDGGTVLWNHFSGDGVPQPKEVTTDPAIVKLCLTAFDSVWERGIDHEDYRPA